MRAELACCAAAVSEAGLPGCNRSQIPNLHVLGNTETSRLAIVSFMVSHEGVFLHYGFVVALLNDIFGVQARGAMACLSQRRCSPHLQQVVAAVLDHTGSGSFA